MKNWGETAFLKASYSTASESVDLSFFRNFQIICKSSADPLIRLFGTFVQWSSSGAIYKELRKLFSDSFFPCQLLKLLFQTPQKRLPTSSKIEVNTWILIVPVVPFAFSVSFLIEQVVNWRIFDAFKEGGICLTSLFRIKFRKSFFNFVLAQKTSGTNLNQRFLLKLTWHDLTVEIFSCGIFLLKTTELRGFSLK